MWGSQEISSKVIQGVGGALWSSRPLPVHSGGPGGSGRASTMSSLEHLIMPGLETLHCVSRADGNSVRPANPAASEHKRNAPAQRNCHLCLDKVYHLTMGSFPLLSEHRCQVLHRLLGFPPCHAVDRKDQGGEV